MAETNLGNNIAIPESLATAKDGTCFENCYRKGKTNIVADVRSRIEVNILEDGITGDTESGLPKSSSLGLWGNRGNNLGHSKRAPNKQVFISEKPVNIFTTE